jgi:hypothetical protein
MTVRSIAAGVFLALVVLSGARSVPLSARSDLLRLDKPSHKKELTAKGARLAFIRQAQVWAPTDVSAMDLRAGPQGAGAFRPNEAVTCVYVEKKLPGTTQKFDCDLGDGDVVKVRYGDENGKVQGAVLASRLLWALGFGADRLYPVRVTCQGCSRDPWNQRARVPGSEQLFDPATIERKPKGHEMKSEHKGGWAWPELDLVDEQQGGAPKAQRDALKLLAVFLQHTDNKEEQERLLCLPKGRTSDECDKPFMMLHDVGLTFGQANAFNRTSVGSVNFDQWSKAPMWRGDPAACVGHMSQSNTGTLGDPKIGEAGRQFLADLLLQLTDQQLRDLFEVARVDHRSRRPNSAEPPATIGEWVSVFKHKRDEIAMNRCKA